MQRLMVAFLNGFVALLLLDGALGVLSGVASMAGLSPFQGIQGIVGVLLLVWAPWMLVALAMVSRAPPSAYLPGVVAVVWMALGAMPLPVHLTMLQTTSIATFVELAVGAWCLWRMRQVTGSSWLTEEALAPGWFRPGYALGMLGVSAVLGPLSVVAWGMWSLGYGVSAMTAGFVTLDLDGVRIAQRSYQRDQAQVHLIGMMHIGEPSAYEGLLDAFPVQGSVVLAEGVTDARHELKEPVSYEATADNLGLTMQRPMQELTDIEVRPADVDLSEFSELTLQLLSSAMVFHGDAPWQTKLSVYQEFAQLIEANQEAAIEGLENDLIHLRNAHLLEQVRIAVKDHQHVIVPWGAYHLKGIEVELLDQGYELVGSDDRLFARWSTMGAALRGQ
jgi:hypothetical protein